MTEEQREEVQLALAKVHKSVANYAMRVVRGTDPHDVLNAAVSELIEAAERDFTTYRKIRNLEARLRSDIRRGVSKLLTGHEKRDAGQLVDGRAERVVGKADSKVPTLLTAIPLDADDTGAHKAQSEIAIRHGSNPLAAMIHRETHEGLARALARIPSDVRQVLEYRYFEEMKPPMIAKVMGISVRQVKRWRQQGLEKLAEILASDQKARERERVRATLRLRGGEA